MARALPRQPAVLLPRSIARVTGFLASPPPLKLGRRSWFIGKSMNPVLVRPVGPRPALGIVGLLALMLLHAPTPFLTLALL